MNTETKTVEKEEVSPEIKIARFIRLMSEGVNYQAVKCEKTVIPVTYDGDWKGDDPYVSHNDGSIVMGDKNLERIGINYFRFFRTVAEVLLSRGVIHTSRDELDWITYEHPHGRTMDPIKKEQLAQKMLINKYAYHKQAYSGPLNTYLPEKDNPKDPEDEGYDAEKAEYNNNIRCIKTYLNHCEHVSNEKARSNQSRVSKESIKIHEADVNDYYNHKKKKKVVKMEAEQRKKMFPEYEIDKLSALLAIPLSFSRQYTDHVKNFLTVFASRNPELFLKHYTIKKTVLVEDKDNEGNVLMHNGKPLMVEHVKEVKKKVTPQWIDNVCDGFADYYEFIREYYNKMRESTSMRYISRYRDTIEHICKRGCTAGSAESPLLIDRTFVDSFEQKMVDHSFEFEVKNKIKKEMLKSQNG